MGSYNGILIIPGSDTRQLISHALATLLEADRSFRKLAHSLGLVDFLSRKLEDLWSLRTLAVFHFTSGKGEKLLYVMFIGFLIILLKEMGVVELRRPNGGRKF